MKIIRKTIALLLVCMLSVVSLFGCTKESADAAAYSIYYTNSDKTKLVTVSYKNSETDKEKLVGAMLDKMSETQKSDDIVVLKPEAVKITKYEVSNDLVNVYFNDEYYNMSNSIEALYRGAVVKTLTQITGIDYVMFYVSDSPVTYTDGMQIGMMSAGDFIDDTDDNVNNLQWSELTLYFANQKGDKLVKDNVSVAYSRSVSVERVIVEQLINGPDIASCSKTLPSGMKLLSISVTDGTCYVNLDSSFLNEMVNVSDTIPIYSIVNSLCELSEIDNVQILVNGDSKKTFRESISLDSTFEMNTELVQTK